MFLTHLTVATLASLAPVRATEPPPQHGKLSWFEGTWEELLAEARASHRIVFLDFWASW